MKTYNHKKATQALFNCMRLKAFDQSTTKDGRKMNARQYRRFKHWRKELSKQTNSHRDE